MNTTDIPELAEQAIEAPSMELKIASWLDEQAKATGVPKLELVIRNPAHLPNKQNRVTASAPKDLENEWDNAYAYGSTIAEAVTALREKIQPERRAAEAREKAAKLMREAAKLEELAQALSGQ